MSRIVRITPPLTDEQVAGLKSGDRVLISGIVFTGRDAAHKRMFELLKSGQKLPIDLLGQIIYYVGPTPARPGKVIGSAGPTTSGRMDIYAPALLAYGLKGMIGKGMRTTEVKEAIKQYKGVYFAATGGAGALLAKTIKKAELVAYPELGPEAIYRLEVADFPAIVINDCYGNDLYLEGIKEYSQLK
ncbi:MAG: Fe-S-containing hydro-lyase [bacterium]|nr:Fe-S-containing hydro-lyase [bacterium]